MKSFPVISTGLCSSDFFFLLFISTNFKKDKYMNVYYIVSLIYYVFSIYALWSTISESFYQEQFLTFFVDLKNEIINNWKIKYTEQKYEKPDNAYKISLYGNRPAKLSVRSINNFFRFFEFFKQIIFKANLTAYVSHFL